MSTLLTQTSGVGTTAVESVAEAAYQKFIGIVNVILPILIGCVVALGLFYGIQLAVKYAKAEEEEDKKKAKGSLINVIVGCLIAIVFIAIIMLVLNGDFIESLFGEDINTSLTPAS